MAKVILSFEGSVIREVQLDKERVTIGRKPQNDIQIENLAVSSEHARIVTILTDSFLEDLDSTNGTLVNGNPIKKHILQHNDVIEIGKYTLKFFADPSAAAAAAAAPAEDFERTMVLRAPPAPARPAAPAAPAAASAPATAAPKAAPPTQPPPRTAPAPAAVPSAAQPASVALPQAFIQILSGPGVGKELPLTKSLTTMGKPGVQVAVITKRPQGYFITHVEGANFPVLNGKKLDDQAHALGDHDLIEIAGVKMEFFFKPA
jgi:pSer/pThr/pTyr-binding forkhead associated (FHA) protein